MVILNLWICINQLIQFCLETSFIYRFWGCSSLSAILSHLSVCLQDIFNLFYQQAYSQFL